MKIARSVAEILSQHTTHRELREAVAPLRGMSLDDYNAGQMTCDLRRLRGLIERISPTQRYRLTAEGLCMPWRTTARLLSDMPHP